MMSDKMVSDDMHYRIQKVCPTEDRTWEMCTHLTTGKNVIDQYCVKLTISWGTIHYDINDIIGVQKRKRENKVLYLRYSDGIKTQHPRACGHGGVVVHLMFNNYFKFRQTIIEIGEHRLSLRGRWIIIPYLPCYRQ